MGEKKGAAGSPDIYELTHPRNSHKISGGAERILLLVDSRVAHVVRRASAQCHLSLHGWLAPPMASHDPSRATVAASYLILKNLQPVQLFTAMVRMQHRARR